MTERQQKPPSERAHPPTDEALWKLLAATTSAAGESFFRELSRSLARALDAPMVFVTEVIQSEPGRLRSLAGWLDGDWDNEHEYEVMGTPCEQVVRTGQPCCYPRQVQQLFPDDAFLARLGVASYIGTPLIGSDRKVIGHICVLDRKPLSDETRSRSILDVFATRAVVEIERRRSVRALDASEQRYRIVAETAADAIITIDRHSKIEYANPSTARIFGHSVKELVGRPITELIPEPWDGHELGGRHRDGSALPIEVSYAEPSRDSAQRFTLIARDISSRRLAEKRQRNRNAALVELATSESLRSGDFRQFLRLALSTAARTLEVQRVSIWFFNFDQTILRCEELLDSKNEELSSGTELEAAQYPRYFAAVSEGRALAAHDAVHDLDTSEFADSYLRPLGISSMLDAPLRRAGELIGVVCHEHIGPPRHWSEQEQAFAASVADVVAMALEGTQRRRAEGTLLERQRQEQQRVEAELEKVRKQLVHQTRLSTIGQVAASIAHELRNPLGSMRNAVFYLKRRGPEAETKWLEYMDILESEIETSDRIISSLLEMSRAKLPALEPTDLEHALRDAFERIETPGAFEMQVDLAPLPFVLDVDPGQLRQILTNLFANALQANATQVQIRARRDESSDVIDVLDNGDGIPEDFRGRIFEPLFTTRARGTGLGLAICNQIAQRHGGSIELLDSAGIERATDDEGRPHILPGTAIRLCLPRT